MKPSLLIVYLFTSTRRVPYCLQDKDWKFTNLVCVHGTVALCPEPTQTTGANAREEHL